MSNQLTETRTSRRDRIVEAARRLFFEQGYVATGIAQILQESGANSGSLYHFFPTKEDLLVAVLEVYRQMLDTAVVAPAMERASDPIEQVFAVLHGYRLLLEATEFRLGCPIGNLGLEIANSHPQAVRLVAENFDGWVEAVASMIRRAAGRLPAGIDPDDLATFVLATMEGAVMLARSHRSLDPFDAAVSHVRDYFERLLEDGSNWSKAQSRKPE